MPSAARRLPWVIDFIIRLVVSYSRRSDGLVNLGK